MDCWLVLLEMDEGASWPPRGVAEKPLGSAYSLRLIR